MKTTFMVAACILFVSLSACSMFQRHAVLKGPDGKVMYEAEIPADSILELAEGDMKIKFDTTGRASFLEQLIMLGVTNTDINFGDDAD